MSLEEIARKQPEQKNGMVKFTSSHSSISVRLEDVQTPNLCPAPMVRWGIYFSSTLHVLSYNGTSTQVNANKRFPKAKAQIFEYNSAKVEQAKKKNPCSKLIPSKNSERNYEKELNVFFSKVR